MKFFFTVLKIVFVTVIILSCGNKGRITIEGKVDGGANKNLLLYEINPNATIFLDTVRLNKKGGFSFNKKIKGPVFLRLNESELNFIFLLIKPGEVVNINARLNDLQTSYEVSGSNSSVVLREYMKQFVFAYREKMKIAEMFRARVDAGESIEVVRREAKYLHREMKDEIVSFTKSFILKNKCSLASVFILDLQLGKNDPILTMENDYKYFDMVDSCLSKNHPELTFVQEYNKTLVKFNEEKRIFSDQKLKVGLKAPEIALSDQHGDTLKLSSIKGKYTLVVFWASWNKASRVLNKELVTLYGQYHKKGLEIFQVGFETNEGQWEKAIEQDGITWPQVRDLKLWDSYLVNLYHVYSVPALYLLSPDKTIIEISPDIDPVSNQLATIFK